jgi:hypothetical protein
LLTSSSTALNRTPSHGYCLHSQGFDLNSSVVLDGFSFGANLTKQKYFSKCRCSWKLVLCTEKFVMKCRIMWGFLLWYVPNCCYLFPLDYRWKGWLLRWIKHLAMIW